MRSASPLKDVAAFAEMGKCLHDACPIAFGQAQAVTVGCHTPMPHLLSHAVTSLGFSTTYVESGSGGRDGLECGV